MTRHRDVEKIKRDQQLSETVDKIEYFKNLNVKTVEMEGATIAAVCNKLGIDYFTFYYAGDNLDSVEWDERSLSGLVNIDKKKEVAIIALEFAIILNELNKYVYKKEK